MLCDWSEGESIEREEKAPVSAGLLNSDRLVDSPDERGCNGSAFWTLVWGVTSIGPLESL